MHPFRAFISDYTDLPDKDWNEIEKHLIYREYAIGELILKEGDVCKKLYFLEHGFLRYFSLKEDGESATKFFTEAPYCFTSQQSFTNKSPSKESIEVLEKAMVWEMPQEMAFELLRLASWSEFVRKLVQEVQFFTQEILEELQAKTAEERYITMLESNSSILNRSPLKYVASYLGIAPQSLSRIRKKYYQQQRS